MYVLVGETHNYIHKFSVRSEGKAQARKEEGLSQVPQQVSGRATQPQSALVGCLEEGGLHWLWAAAEEREGRPREGGA